MVIGAVRDLPRLSDLQGSPALSLLFSFIFNCSFAFFMLFRFSLLVKFQFCLVGSADPAIF